MLKKELQLHHISLIVTTVLFFIHLFVLWLRVAFVPAHRNSLAEVASECFWLLWLLVPLIIGATSIAEERKLGTLDGQLCLPVATRRQWVVKLAMVIFWGGLLPCVLPLAAESLAGGLGLKAALPAAWALPVFVLAACGLALVAFYASNLSRNLLQALPLAVGFVVVAGLLATGFNEWSGLTNHGSPQGIIWWSPGLAMLMLAVTLVFTLPWLAYRNYCQLAETARLWRRNGLAWLAVVVFTALTSSLMYHRAWEKLTPVEPAHGPARWVSAQSPSAMATTAHNNLLVTLPDGRTWLGVLTEPSPPQENSLTERVREWLNLPASPRLSVQRAVTDTNYASVVAGQVDVWVQSSKPIGGPFRHVQNSRETVAIKADGTLWVSAQPGTKTGDA